MIVEVCVSQIIVSEDSNFAFSCLEGGNVSVLPVLQRSANADLYFDVLWIVFILFINTKIVDIQYSVMFIYSPAISFHTVVTVKSKCTCGALGPGQVKEAH